MFYSLIENGFFNKSVSNPPEDAIELCADEYHSAYKALCEGKIPNIVGGKLVFSDAEHVNQTPDFVTRAQGKSALIRAGLWQGVVDFVNSISDPVEKAVAEVALSDTTHWQRSSPFLNSAAHALGLTDEQLDDLFIEASKIEL